MPTHKPDLSLLSMAQLGELTGFHHGKLKRKLEGLEPADRDGKTLFYRPREALPRLYSEQAQAVQGEAPSARLDGDQEDAKLKRLRAQKVALEIAELEGALVRVDLVESTWANLVGAMRARMLAIPSRAAQTVPDPKHRATTEAQVRDLVYDALQELSQYDPEELIHGSSEEGAEDSGTSAEADSQPVGGSEPEAIERVLG